MNSEYSILNLLQKSKDFLDKKNVAGNTRLDAEILLAKVLNLDRIKIYMQYDRVLSEEEINNYRELIIRRSKHEPVAYITGSKEFFHLDFIVNKDVLIPRPESEELVSWVLEYFSENKFSEIVEEENSNNYSSSTHEVDSNPNIATLGATREANENELKQKEQVDSKVEPSKEDEALRVLDLACGSGCIGISLKKHKPSWQVCFSDVSNKATLLCKTNYEKLLESTLEEDKMFVSDYFSTFPEILKNSFDVIVSNPPYIPLAIKKSIMPDVLNWEPHLALFTQDPLALYKNILNMALPFLKEGASIFMEGAPEFLTKLTANYLQEHSITGYKFKEIKKDLSKKDRMIHFIKIS